MNYWLMKSEPDVFSIDDLKRDGRCVWEGVRNYQARNYMRDEMKKGDLVLFYHSNAKPPGIAGLAIVDKEAYPDPFQFDPKSKYFDDKASKENPRWVCVNLRFIERFEQELALDALKADPKLDGMLVIKKGSRLSVQPVEPKHFKHVLKKAGARSKAN
ncbi:MAG: EVE domain-containing protein [Myxococcales bacterium]|nr:MAG: EVE domain-containing protein [Myxococcales bacterium]